MRAICLIGCTLSFLAASVGTHASTPAAPSVLNLKMLDPKCTIRAAGDAEIAIQNSKYIKTLDQQLQGMKRWDAFMASRKWKKGVTMGEQMTPKELATFDKLRQETKVGLIATMFADKRMRDLRVFLTGANLAEQMRLQKETSKNEASEEFIIAAILVGGREALKANAEEAAPIIAQSGQCTFERALIAEANRTTDITRMSATVDAAQAVLERLAGKHGKPINPDVLQPDERAQFDEAVLSVSRTSAQVNYFTDLLLLARMERVSKLQRDVREQSLIEAPGDNDHINVVWETWKKEGRISADQDQLSRVLNFINTKIPGEFSKTMTDQIQPKDAKP